MLLRTLASHYRAHPVQALFLLAGIATANVLLVGTLLINAQARASYAQGERWLNARPVATLRPGNGAASIAEREYFRLRRAGFDNLVPVLRRVETASGGQTLELLGIDAFAMPRVSGSSSPDLRLAAGDLPFARRGQQAERQTPGDAAFAFPPYRLLAAPARIRQLGWAAGTRPRLASGRELPPLAALPGAGLGYRLLLDIGVLQDLTGSQGSLSYVLVFDAPAGRLEALQAALPAMWDWDPAAAALDPVQLTRSFHLNLSAMGLLTFVVGIFLIYNALAFSYTDRRETMRKLRLNGVTRRELGLALLLELVLFVAAGTALGCLLGSFLASRLLPGVGMTLAQLYGVYIAYPDRLLAGGLAWPVVMTLLASALCAALPLRQVLGAPLLPRRSLRWDEQAMVRRDRYMLLSGVALLAVAAVLALAAEVLWLALAATAAVLLGAALCLPAFLRAVLGRLATLVPARCSRLSWLAADCRWLLGPASLALMVMVLALVANSGLNTMISSFRQATVEWLQQRLVAQLYLRGEVDAAQLEAWLEREAPAVHLAERYRLVITASTPSGAEVAIEVASRPDFKRFAASTSLMERVPGAAELFRAGAGLYISERAWRLDGWKIGDRVSLCSGMQPLPVLGVYRDYGNPRSQWLSSPAVFQQCWPERRPESYALFSDGPVDWERLRDGLAAQFGFDESRLVNQQQLVAIGLGVFDRTFTVTRALNVLTLLVAAVGIFCAIASIHHHRLAQQALLAALGVSRTERALLLTLQWGLLGLLCVLLVWPFGTLLAWILSAVVTPVAFGWSFALQPDWRHLPALVLTAVGALVLAILLPSLRLVKASPAHLLREQTT
jgi:putative ABC transport system permease protein